MAEKMCENTGFLDITDIYASDICLVEHSYGYNSTEYILSDTKLYHLKGDWMKEILIQIEMK